MTLPQLAHSPSRTGPPRRTGARAWWWAQGGAPHAGRLDDALTAAGEAVATHRQLTALNTEPPIAGLATALHDLAIVLVAAERVDEAIPAIPEAIDIRRHLVTSDPQWRPNLAVSLWVLVDRFGNAATRGGSGSARGSGRYPPRSGGGRPQDLTRSRRWPWRWAPAWRWPTARRWPQIVRVRRSRVRRRRCRAAGACIGRAGGDVASAIARIAAGLAVAHQHLPCGINPSDRVGR